MRADPFEERITGTRLFTAHRLFFPGHLHSLSDDLESLLYVSLHVATDGQLPWAHSPDKNMDATKHWHLTLDAPFQELLGKCAETSRPFLTRLRGIVASGLSATHPLTVSSGPSSALFPAVSSLLPMHASVTDDHDLVILRAFRDACRSHMST